MKNLILLIAILITGLVSAQDQLIIEINGMTTYEVVVEDNMINYPMGKDFPGRVGTVGNGYIFLDTRVPTHFYENNRKPVGVHEDATPRFRYFDRLGHARFLEVNQQNGDQFYLPIGPNFNGQWEWHVNCPDCVERYQAFGPAWNRN